MLGYRHYRYGKKLNLKNKFILVTGCDSGIGLQTVQHLAEDSEVHIIAICLTDEGTKRVQALGAVTAIKCDLKDPRSIRQAATLALSVASADIWAVVHCAGLVKGGFLDFQPISNFREVMEVNFFGTVALNQLLMPAVKRAQGRVVFVSSVAGLVPFAGVGPYGCSKYAIEAYAGQLKLETGLWNIHIATVNPSAMKTPMTDSYSKEFRSTWEKMARADNTCDAYVNDSKDWMQEWDRGWLDRFVEANQKLNESVCEDPIIVAKDIKHAIGAVHPRSRYLSGTFAKTLIHKLWCLPEAQAYKLSKALMPIYPPPTPLIYK
ncbi:unnamed protein product [Heterosigma akashiwo]